MQKAAFLCILVISSLAVNVPNHQAIMYDALSSKLKATSMGRAVLLMAELKQSNFNPLFDALEGWATQLEDSIATENASHTALIQQLNQDRTFYQEQADKYDNEVAELQIAIREILQSRIALEADLEKQRKELGETKQQKSTIEQQMQEDLKSFKSENDNLNSAIVAIDEALKLLEKAKSSSFIEQDALELSNIAKTVSAMPKLLIELAAGDYKDTANLKNVIGLLQNIRNQFTQNAQILVSQFGATKEATEELIAQYNVKIEQIAQESIPQLQQDIQTRDAELNSKKELLAQAQSDLEAAKDGVNAMNEDEQHSTGSHTTLINEYHNGLDTIAECIQALNVSGIKRQ